MNKNKAKGKRFEYEIRDYFISIGFADCIISSSESLNADNMGIDLLNIPLIVQCKSGYKNGINYVELIKTITKRVKSTKYEKLPVMIFHKTTKYKVLIALEYGEFKKIYERESINLEDFKYIQFTDGIILVDFISFKPYIKKWLKK